MERLSGRGLATVIIITLILANGITGLIDAFIK